MSSSSKGASPSPPKKLKKPCSRCPHRLSDLASHAESSETDETDETSEALELAKSNKVDILTAAEDEFKDDEVAEASTAPPPASTTSTSATTEIEVPALVREDAFKVEEREGGSDTESAYFSTYQKRRESVRFEIDLSPEEVAERVAAAEEAGKRASGGARPKTILKTWEEVEKVDNWPVTKKVVRFKEVRFKAVRFVTDPEIYHIGSDEEEEEDDDDDDDDGSSTLVDQSQGTNSRDHADSDQNEDGLAKAAENLYIYPLK